MKNMKSQSSDGDEKFVSYREFLDKLDHSLKEDSENNLEDIKLTCIAMVEPLLAAQQKHAWRMEELQTLYEKSSDERLGVAAEQLEQFAEIQFTEIGAAAGRSARDDWKGLIGASENPNGPLSAFVDRLFVKKNPDPAKFPKYRPENYLFIYSHLEDNPYVSKDYVDNLATMRPEKRDMYRYGNRDVFAGQFFPRFNATEHVVSLP